MKLTAQEFQQLQAEWYKKLRESGFEDIEEVKYGDIVLKRFPERHTHKIFNNWEAKSDYFAAMGTRINDPKTKFRNKIDKIILKLHSAGISHLEIVDVLKDLGICKHRNTVRNIIWRYQWEWKLRLKPPKYYQHNHRKAPTQS